MKKLSLQELERNSISEFKNKEKSPIVIVLDNIRSMNNVGSIFRTADAFAVEKIYLCGVTAQPPHREISKTAIGAEKSMDWQYFEKVEDAVLQLKKEGFSIVLVEQTDASIFLQDKKYTSTDKVAYVFGNEVRGVSDEILPLADEAIEIPQFGTKHSFNVSISAGIVLWDYFLKRDSLK